MKKKEYQDLKIKAYQDLNKLLKDKRLEFRKTKVDLKVSREKNLKKVKNLRRDIAQILTIIREKEIAEKEVSKQERQGK